MFLFLLLSFSVDLESTGDLFYGYWTTGDTLLNSDVSFWTSIDLFEINESTDLFVRYSTYLEMATQKGKVVLDPLYSSYSLRFGLKYYNKLYFSFFIDHYCRHIIDRELQEGKVVFNAEHFVLSSAEKNIYRFREDLYYNFSYIFYPQGIIVDWLNSKPYYRHRFLFTIQKNIFPHLDVSLEGEYTLSNDVPRKVYHKIKPGIYSYLEKNNSVIYTFIHYYLSADDPLRPVDNVVFLGAGFSF